MKHLEGSRIYVAGHRGLVGSAVVRVLRTHGLGEGLLLATHSELELSHQASVDEFFGQHRPDIVILCAARVGGILDNFRNQAAMLRDNLAVACNVIEAAARVQCRKLLFLGSSCIYPRLAPQPITEDALLTGPLEPTNRGYAIAKIAGVEMARAYAAAGRLATVSLMPTNLYGPFDNFDAERAHVLPALLARIHQAKIRGDGEVGIWGSGEPKREFLHVDDLARAILAVLERDPGPDPINVGWGEDVTIRELAQTIARIVGYEGRLVFDRTKPDGTPRKLLDSSRMRGLGWAPTIDLEEGLKTTYRWYLENVPA